MNIFDKNDAFLHKKSDIFAKKFPYIKYFS